MRFREQTVHLQRHESRKNTCPDTISVPLPSDLIAFTVLSLSFYNVISIKLQCESYAFTAFLHTLQKRVFRNYKAVRGLIKLTRMRRTRPWRNNFQTNDSPRGTENRIVSKTAVLLTIRFLPIFNGTPRPVQCPVRYFPSSLSSSMER